MIKSLVFFTTLLVSSFSWAQEAHCLEQGSQICASLEFLSPLSPDTEGIFLVKFEGLKDEQIRDMKMELWMDMGHGHGHGSAPLEIEQLAPDRFKVSNAWFVMRGDWVLRTYFYVDSKPQGIIFPIHIPY